MVNKYLMMLLWGKEGAGGTRVVKCTWQHELVGEIIFSFPNLSSAVTLRTTFSRQSVVWK